MVKGMKSIHEKLSLYSVSNWDDMTFLLTDIIYLPS